MRGFPYLFSTFLRRLSLNAPTSRSPVVLGIETSCDDTAVGIVGGDGTVYAEAISSQWELHSSYQGLFGTY